MGGPAVIIFGRLGDVDKRRVLVYNRYVYLEGARDDRGERKVGESGGDFW